MSLEDAPDVAGRDDPDGTTIIVRRLEEVQGATGPGGTATEFHMRDQAPAV